MAFHYLKYHDPEGLAFNDLISVQNPRLYRICCILGISLAHINLFLLCLTILEEVCCYLREQCIGQNVLILLLPFLHFGFELVHLVC